MYTPDALADLHARGHTSLRRLLEHCAPFTADELHRELEGFGYPSMQRQLAHVIGAEHYWVGVLHGVVDAEDRDDAYPTVAALEGWRGEVEARTRAYLDVASVEELNTPRAMTMWGGPGRRARARARGAADVRARLPAPGTGGRDVPAARAPRCRPRFPPRVSAARRTKK